jgi:hypothetical protein
MKRFLRIGTTALVGASALALGALSAAPARADVVAQLEGWHSPASDTLPLEVKARSAARLIDATMTVDGAAGVPVKFCADTEPACTDGRAKLPLDTTKYADGVRQLVITVRDSDGLTSVITTFVDVWNHRPNQCPSPNSPPNTCNAQLSIGSDPTSEPPAVNPGPNGGGGTKGASESSCTSPRLSMSLAQKPLRVSHGVPVLLKNKRYRFTGRLTCVINGKRKSAAKGSRVEVRNTVGRKTVRKPSGKVGNGGKITVLLKYPSSRTIEFRFTSADGKTSKVRIKVRIAQRKR